MARPELSEDLHELKGTKSQRQTPCQSGFAGGRPRMPKTLSPLAQEKWKELVRVLNKRGTLTTADAGLLEIVSELYARWRLYNDDVQKRGAYVEQEFQDKNGEAHTRSVPNPSTKLVGQMDNTLARYLIQLGITPASREKAKPTAPRPPKKDAIVPGSLEDLKRQLAAMPPEQEEITALEGAEHESIGID